MKKRTKTKEAQKNQPIEEQEFEQRMVDYLQADEDFFVRHSGLLSKLTLPHPSGVAVSLVERQMALLREQNRELERKLNDLIENAKVNGSLNKKMQELVLAVLAAATPQAMFEALFSSLRADFNVDVLALWLFFDAHSAPPSFPDYPGVTLVSRDSPELSIFSSVLKSTQPVCGQLTAEQGSHLFGEAAERTVSCALIPLGVGNLQHQGLLALGSQESDRFRADLGTLFLDYLGAVAGRALGRHWI